MRGASRTSTKTSTTIAAIAKTEVKFSPRLKAAPGLRISRSVSSPPSSRTGSRGIELATARILVMTSSARPLDRDDGEEQP